MNNAHSDHVTPVSTYVLTYLALMVLLALTVAASQMHIGPASTSLYNNLIAMAISVTKAVLVVLFFMGVRYGSRLVWLWSAAGFVWLTLMGITLFDYLTRVYLKGW